MKNLYFFIYINMAKEKFEKQELSGEARLFDSKRDIKNGKQILIDSWSTVFFANTLKTIDNKELINEEREITQWDTIIIIGISKQDIVLRVQTWWADLEAWADILEYKIKKEVFLDVFSGATIKVIKPRKAPKIQKLEDDTKNIVEKIIRPSIYDMKEWSIFRVIEDWFLLPQRKKPTRSGKSNFNEREEPLQLFKWDIIRVLRKEKALRNAQNPYVLELELEVFSSKWNEMVEREKVLTSVWEFQEYMSRVLKPLKDTQKVRDQVELLIDKSKIILWVSFWSNND